MPVHARRRRSLIALAAGTAVVGVTAAVAPLGSSAAPGPASAAPVPAVPSPGPAPSVSPVPVLTPQPRGLASVSTPLVSWAPDGSRLAYVSGASVVTAHPDGSGGTTVASGFTANALAWSAGGARIAFSASEAGRPGDLPQLWIGTPLGQRPFKATVPTASGRRTTAVTWLDGVTLVVSYTTAHSGPSRLALVTLRKPVAVTQAYVPSDPSASLPTTQLLDPVAAPGGGRLAYRQRVPDGAGGTLDSLWVAGPRGGGARRLGQAATLGRPAWSADGRTVFATRTVGPVTDVLAYPVAGGAPVVVRSGLPASAVLLRTPPASGRAAATRITGRDAVATSIAASRRLWHTLPVPRRARAASAAVLVGAGAWADAASAAPLAVAKGGPLLLTGRRLDPRVVAELRRVLPARHTVYLVGSTRTLPAPVATTLTRLRYRVVRLAGADEYATSVAVAVKGLGAPRTVVLADGRSWQEALVAASAAGSVGGAVLLTNGTATTRDVRSYLRRYTPVGYAVGRSAAAAVHSATPLAARTAPATAVVVARALYLPASTAVLATASAWQDALPAAALAGTLGQPLLLVGGAALPVQVSAYLDGASGSLDGVLAFGRPRVPTSGVLVAAARWAAGRAVR